MPIFILGRLAARIARGRPPSKTTAEASPAACNTRRRLCLDLFFVFMSDPQWRITVTVYGTNSETNSPEFTSRVHRDTHCQFPLVSGHFSEHLLPEKRVSFRAELKGSSLDPYVSVCRACALVSMVVRSLILKPGLKIKDLTPSPGPEISLKIFHCAFSGSLHS